MCESCNENLSFFKGNNGVGISHISSNGDGTFTIHLTDGTFFVSPNYTGPQGPQGPTGATGPQGAPGVAGLGITNITDNGDGTLTITYGNGTTLTTTNLTGPQGPQGLPATPIKSVQLLSYQEGRDFSLGGPWINYPNADFATVGDTLHVELFIYLTLAIHKIDFRFGTNIFKSMNNSAHKYDGWHKVVLKATTFGNTGEYWKGIIQINTVDSAVSPLAEISFFQVTKPTPLTNLQISPIGINNPMEAEWRELRVYKELKS